MNIKRTLATGIAAATLVSGGLLLSACGNSTEDKVNDAVAQAQASANSVAASVQAQVGSAVASAQVPAGVPTGEYADQTKVLAFVSAFRTGYPELAAGRDDAAVKKIRTETCADIKAGKSPADLTAKLSERARNNTATLQPPKDMALLETIRATC